LRTACKNTRYYKRLYNPPSKSFPLSEKNTSKKKGEGKRIGKETKPDENKQKHITTSIFGVGRCEAAHKYENGDFCQKITRNNKQYYFLKKAR